MSNFASFIDLFAGWLAVISSTMTVKPPCDTLIPVPL